MLPSGLSYIVMHLDWELTSPMSVLLAILDLSIILRVMARKVDVLGGMGSQVKPL